MQEEQAEVLLEEEVEDDAAAGVAGEAREELDVAEEELRHRADVVGLEDELGDLQERADVRRVVEDRRVGLRGAGDELLRARGEGCG